MDSLLEKLRAAAPQARDQRDRRRRARLQNRHQVRVASGQKIPDPEEIPEVEEGLMSPDSISTEGLLSPGMQPPTGSEDDIAERAALLLQGMRGSEGTEDAESERRESVRRSRRRENADEERKARRRRREKATSTSEALEDDAIPEEDDEPLIESQTTEASEAYQGGKEKEPTPTMDSSPNREGSEKIP